MSDFRRLPEKKVPFSVIGSVRRVDSTTFQRRRLVALFPVMLYLVALWLPDIAVAGDIAGSASDQPQSILLADASKDSCVAECKGVRKQCKTLCGETSARAKVQTGDDPHKPEGVCLQNCEEDYTFCIDSC